MKQVSKSETYNEKASRESMSRFSKQLDDIYLRLLSGDIFEGMETLCQSLTALRSELQQTEWISVCEKAIWKHPVFRFVHQAPFTRRAYEKPRGYPGDAETLDFIYGLKPLPSSTNEQIQRLYAWEFQTPSCRSVRARKGILAEQIDLTRQREPHPRIFSLACGHLREARESDLVMDRQADAFFAVDQDLEALSVVTSELSVHGVRGVPGSVRGVLTSKIAYSDIDFAYAAGLYDYLAEGIATQLTAKLFAMLRNGGRLLTANFNPTLRDIGYLEGFMDWRLLYRSDADMFNLTSAIPESEIAS